MIRRPPRSTQRRSSAASDVYKRQVFKQQKLSRRENGVRDARLWRTLLGVEKTVVGGIDLDDEGDVLVARVGATGSMRNRCGQCLRRCPGYDPGEGRRRWRTQDAGTIRVELEADAPRVKCKTHGVTVAAVPW